MTTTSPGSIGRALLISGSMLALATSASSAKTDLRWKFQEGQVWHYLMVQDTTMTTKVPADSLDLKQGLQLTIDQTWTVKAVNPSGVATLTQTIDRIRTTADLPIGKVTFDSREARDANSAAGPLFKMMVGAEFVFKMNPRGEISDIKLPEKMVATLRSGHEPDGAQGQFSESGLKNMLVQMGILLPEGPVDVGQKWSRKMAVPAGPEGETRSIDQTYTYQGPDAQGVEGIDLTIGFEPPKPDPNIQVTIRSQTSSGRIGFDRAAGRIALTRVTMHVESTSMIMGKEIAQSFETTTAMTFVPMPTR